MGITILGVVARQDWSRLDQVARELLKHTYWNTFHHPEHLKGWLLTNFHCAYCETYLPDAHIQYRRAHTDHLLPHSRYPELKSECMMNAVATCDECNSLKGRWDPNSEADGQEMLYKFEGELSYTTRLKLIERTRAFLKDKTGRDKHYMAECRAAAEKAQLDLA